MPSAQFDHRVSIPVPRTRVWKALQEPNTWSGLGPVQRVWDAEFDHGALCRYRWSAQAGPRSIHGTATTRQALEPELMVVELDAGEMQGMLTTELVAGPGDLSTELTVVLSIEANGMLSSLFWGVISQTIGSGLPGQVEGFAARLAAA